MLDVSEPAPQERDPRQHDPHEQALRFEQVTKRFGRVMAVDRADFAVASGEFFAMLGPSGSGKTTCLRLVAGFERPSAGRVLLDGHDVSGLAPFERDVNTVFQDYALFPHMTVADNVGYGLTVRRVPRSQRQDRIDEALAMVRLPVADYGSRRPSALSGGQRQRVALARALINRPRLLLLDEPLGALDLKLRQEMQGELKRIQQEVGITFVFVTHDQEEALTLSDRLAVFNQGRVEQVGRPVDVYERPETEFVAGFVGTSNILRGELARRLAPPGDRDHPAAALSIRPEKISLAPVGAAVPPDQVGLGGVVREVDFVGAFRRYVVDVDGAELVVVQQNTTAGDESASSGGFAPGADVLASWSRSALRPLAEAAEGGSPEP